MKKYRRFKYWCSVAIFGLQINICYAQEAPPEFELTSASTSSGDICGVRAFSQITRCTEGMTITDTVCINGSPCTSNPIACTSGPTEGPTNEYSIIAEAEAVVLGDVFNQSVTSTVSHEIAYSLMDTSDSLLFSGNSIVLHEIIFGGDCEFVCLGIKPKGQTTWSGDGCADFSIDFSLSKSAIIRLTELHSTSGRMVGGGVNDEALSSFSWQVIDLSPPPGCSSPCIALQGIPSILGPNETYNAGGPSDVGLESGDYRFEAFYDYSPRNPLQCVANQNPPADEKLIQEGSGEVGGGVCGPDPCLPASCSNGEIDEWRIELLIVGDDCNGNGIADSLDVDPNDPDGNGFVSEDFNLDGIPDECQCFRDVAPIDLQNNCNYGDGVLNLLDILRVEGNKDPNPAVGPNCVQPLQLDCFDNCILDIDGDGQVDLFDTVAIANLAYPLSTWECAPGSAADAFTSIPWLAPRPLVSENTNGRIGVVSDLSAGVIVAEDVKFTESGDLTEILWFGFETNSDLNAQLGLHSRFRIRVYRNTLSPVRYGSNLHPDSFVDPVTGLPNPGEGDPLPVPGEFEAEWYVTVANGDLKVASTGVEVTQFTTGVSLPIPGSHPMIAYSATLSNPLSIASGDCIWIEIVSDPLDPSIPDWLWADQGDNSNFHIANANVGAGDLQPGNDYINTTQDLVVPFSADAPSVLFNLQFVHPTVRAIRFSSFCFGDVDCMPQLNLDCDGNGIIDWCDLDNQDGIHLDCNYNGIPDSCDIASGFSQDVNSNGIPDCCEAVPPNCP